MWRKRRKIVTPELHSFFSTMSSNVLVYMTPSSLIMVLSLPPPLLENSLASSSTMSNFSPFITLKLTDEQNQPIKNSKLISRSSVPTTHPHGLNSYPPQNSIITLPHTIPLRNCHSFSCMGMNYGKTFLPALKNHLSILNEARKEALAAHESTWKIMASRTTC